MRGSLVLISDFGILDTTRLIDIPISAMMAVETFVSSQDENFIRQMLNWINNSKWFCPHSHPRTSPVKYLRTYTIYRHVCVCVCVCGSVWRIPTYIYGGECRLPLDFPSFFLKHLLWTKIAHTPRWGNICNDLFAILLAIERATEPSMNRIWGGLEDAGGYRRLQEAAGWRGWEAKGNKREWWANMLERAADALHCTAIVSGKSFLAHFSLLPASCVLRPPISNISNIPHVLQLKIHLPPDSPQGRGQG